MTFSYRYPDAQIDNKTDYLEIKVLEYQPPNVAFSNQLEEREDIERAKDGTQIIKKLSGVELARGVDQYKNKEKSLGYIFLPIPQAVADSTGVDWSGTKLNPFAAAGIAAGLGVADSDEGFFSALRTEASNLSNRFLKDASPDQKRAVQTFFATQAVNAFNANVSVNEVLARTTGQIVNQNTELLFNGINLRSFNFSFSLTPRRRKESETIKNILRTFKKNMSAKRENGIFLNSPNIFQLCYKTGRQKHAYLNSFFPTALTQMDVNYTGAGKYATYEDTSPVSILLTLQFSEISPIYQSDYDEGDGLIGVGY